MKPKAKLFRIRRSDAPLARTEGADDAPGARATSGDAAMAGSAAPAQPDTSAEAERDAIRAEGLTGRQLRMARRVAQKHGITPESDLDAVRLLRQRGIDPFKRANMLDLVVNDETRADGSNVAQLPQTYQEPRTPSTEFAPPPSRRNSELEKIQRDIARRRRRRLALLAARLMAFVLLPTLIAGYYYYAVATPLYATHSEFVIQQANAPQPAGGAASLFSGTAMATSQDSITVQSYLQSREAMQRLDADHGFKAHFSEDRIDPLLRLAPDASDEAAYDLYQDMVQIGYDPTEGIVRMEVIAADPQVSAQFSRALIGYAEEQVDQLTRRMREDQMQGAREMMEEAELRMQEAQSRVVELQERYEVLSSDVEVSLLTNQISTLQSQLTQERLELQQLLSNPSPSEARVRPLERRIENLREEIASLRDSLTRNSGESASLARISSELAMAESDVQTRQMMLSQSMQQLEAARAEAGRQVRYLSMGVEPTAPDAPTYPRAFENTALALLIFAGIYLMLSMTAAILREQVSA